MLHFLAWFSSRTHVSHFIFCPAKLPLLLAITVYTQVKGLGHKCKVCMAYCFPVCTVEYNDDSSRHVGTLSNISLTPKQKLAPL